MQRSRRPRPLHCPVRIINFAELMRLVRAADHREEEMPPEPTAKRGGAGGPAGADDRLGALPDGLLHAVLSFLPAPQAVRTSVLSRRWRDLWRSAPCINIDELEFGITWIDQDVMEENWSKFEDFTTNLLLFRDNTSSLDKFRVHAHVHNHRDVDRWIRRGLKYCPRVLELFLDASFTLPHLGSSSRRLQRMHLSHVRMDNCFAELLCSGFPVLEELEIRACHTTFQDIRLPTLKKLAIDNCININRHPLVIMAPDLTSFHLTNCSFPNGISVCKMDSLVKATIDIYTGSFPVKYQHRLLGNLSSATSLELRGFETTAIFNEKSDKLLIFPNIRALSLKKCFLDECDLDNKLEALGSVLQNAPCLEKLTLHCCMFEADPEMEYEKKCITLQCHDRKSYQCQKLKLIEVMYEDNYDHQLIQLFFFLRGTNSTFVGAWEETTRY